MAGKAAVRMNVDRFKTGKHQDQEEAGNREPPAETTGKLISEKRAAHQGTRTGKRASSTDLCAELYFILQSAILIAGDEGAKRRWTTVIQTHGDGNASSRNCLGYYNLNRGAWHRAALTEARDFERPMRLC